MKRMALLVIIISCVLSSYCFASEIYRISLSDLQEKSDLIVLAKVVKIEQVGNNDKVSIEVGSFLKGNSQRKYYTFTLVTRGGLKDFDPLLTEGDAGVFFLKIGELEGEVEKAYWGGIAIFQKNHFDL